MRDLRLRGPALAGFLQNACGRWHAGSIMEVEFPRIDRIRIGYAAREDRLVLIAELPGHVRRAFLTRRLVRNWMQRMSEQLSATHPAAARTADPGEVLQMEHLAAVAGARGEAGKPRTDESAPVIAISTSTHLPVTDFLITRIGLECRGPFHLVGLHGVRRESAQPGDDSAEPVAGLRLARANAHQLLRLLRDQAKSADWDLDVPAEWMAPMTLRGVGN